jgi:hypothetical protein
MHPAATRQLADEVETHGAAKRTKKELKELLDTVPMAIENKKRAASKPLEDRPRPLEDAPPPAPNKKPRAASARAAIEDAPPPAPPKKSRAAVGTDDGGVKEQVKPEAKARARKAESVKPEKIEKPEPRGRTVDRSRSRDPRAIEDKPKPRRNAKTAEPKPIEDRANTKPSLAMVPAAIAAKEEMRVPKGKGTGRASSKTSTVTKTLKSKNAYPFALVAA